MLSLHLLVPLESLRLLHAIAPPTLSCSRMPRRFAWFRPQAGGLLSAGMAREADCIGRSVAGDLPGRPSKCSLAWQRGAKLQYTAAAFVDGQEHVVYWDETLKQSTSMVKDGHRFLPKEYSLKLQAVGQGKGGEQRQTIAKCRLDLARYCSCDQVFAQEVTLELKPQGTLRCSIRAVWLQHVQPELDGMTDLSCMSMGKSAASSDLVMAEQDLEGFDDSSASGRQASISMAGPLGSGLSVTGTPSKKRMGFSLPLSGGSLLPGSPAKGARQASPDHGADRQPGPLEQGELVQPMLKRLSSASGLPPSSQVAQPGDLARRTASARGSALGGASPAVQVTPRLWSDRKMTTPFATPLQAPTPNSARAHSRSKGTIPAHRRSRSTPLALDLPSDFTPNSKGPASPIPEDYEKTVAESYATLANSDSEEEGVGIVASAKRWLAGASRKGSALIPGPEDLVPAHSSGDAVQPAAGPTTEDELVALSREEDCEALRERCIVLLRERDSERAGRQQAERQAGRLQLENDALVRAKAMLTERLAVSEEKLLQMAHNEVMDELVTVKLEAAQADFKLLEMQGSLTQEKAKSRMLMSKLTTLETEFYAIQEDLNEYSRSVEL
eukprot:jgi/Astpho2/7174/fgenesh1_pg.00113_%23_17_t